MRHSPAIIRILAAGLLAAVTLAILLPVAFTLLGSLMSPGEIEYYFGPVYEGTAEEAVRLHLLPDRLSLESWYQVLLRRPDYLIKFWNSLLLCTAIVLGQLTVSCMGGFAFAKYRFRHKEILYYILIILMLMPVQVTLVPNYIVLDWLGLLDRWACLVLPVALAPFGTFLMTQVFKSVPDELLDAARLDGASTRQQLVRIMIPAAQSGVVSLALLAFIDAWNMVEQPVTFLRDASRYPLSVFLASVNSENFPLSFACGVLALLPVLLLFLFFQKELVQGIEFSGLK